MSRLRVVAVASSEETRAKLFLQLQSLDFVQFDGVCIELSDAVSKCQRSEPDILVVELTGRELDAGLFIQAIGMNPENPCVIFALHRDMDLEIFKDAVRQGAKEFIQYPEDTESLTVALKKHLTLLSKVAVQNISYPQPTEQALPQATKGQLITVFGAKGGAGSSTVAANTAYEMKQLGKKVAFLDLDQFYCNSEVLMASKPEYAISDLSTTNPKDVDASMIDKLTLKHATGIHIVVGCKSVLDDNEMIPPELLEVILDHLLSQYDMVLVDLPNHVLDPYHQYMVERADTLLLVSGSDIPSLYRTRQYLDLAQKYLEPQKIKLVLNRYNLKAAYGMTNAELEAKFKFDIFARIANDWDLNVEANSVGSPMSKLNPKSEIVKGYQKLAKQLCGDDAGTLTHPTPTTKQGGLLSKLLPGKGKAAHVVQ